MTLNKRNIKRTPRPVAADESEVPNVVLPDPEAEEAAKNPVSYRKGMPPHRIATTCTCGIEMEIYVDDVEEYPPSRLQQVFRERGSSFKPPICKWCMTKNRKSRHPVPGMEEEPVRVSPAEKVQAPAEAPAGPSIEDMFL